MISACIMLCPPQSVALESSPRYHVLCSLQMVIQLVPQEVAVSRDLPALPHSPVVFAATPDGCVSQC